MLSMRSTKMPGKSRKLLIEQSSDSSSYQVQKILQKKIKNGKQLYKVVWKGYPISQATWQPKSNMNNCSQLILQFELSKLPEQEKAEMINIPLNKPDNNDEVQNIPLNIYETNLQAVHALPQMEQIKTFISVLDRHLGKQSQLPESCKIQEVVQAQQINEDNQPSFYKVRISADKRYFKVKRSEMLQNLSNRVRLIEYYQRLDCKH